MRIAVTGSTGFIGTALCASLESDGHDVLRVVRSGGGSGSTPWDPQAGTIDPAAFEGLDGVVHLAGEGIATKRWSDAQKRRIHDSRTKSTALLAEALASLDHKPRVMISGSGIDAYGDRGDEVLTESSALGPSGFLRDLVVDWEAATGMASAAGIRVATIRTSMVLDAGGGALPRLLSLGRLGLLGRLGSGRQWMSWITLHDEVQAIRFLLDHELAGPVNLAAPEPVTNLTFTKALGQALHRPTVVPVPRFGPRLLLGRELADTLLFESKRVVPEALQQAGFRFQHPTLAEALQSILT
jgi:hypothetical protein